MSDELRARIEAALEPHTHNGHLVDAELGDVVDTVMSLFESEESEDDLAEQMCRRKLGVYRLYWHSGGSSVAAVGMLYDGSRWYAPANWTTGSVDADRANVVGTDWSGIERVELIEAYRNTTRRCETGPEDAL